MAFLVDLAAEGDKSLQVLIEIRFLLGLEILHLGVVQGGHEVVEGQILDLQLLKVPLEQLTPLFVEVVPACYYRVRIKCALTFENQRQFEELDGNTVLVVGVVAEVLLEHLLLDLAEVDGVGGDFLFLLLLLLGHGVAHWCLGLFAISLPDNLVRVVILY